MQGVALKTVIEREYPESKVDLIDYRSNNNIVYPNRIRQMAPANPCALTEWKSWEWIWKQTESSWSRKYIDPDSNDRIHAFCPCTFRSILRETSEYEGHFSIQSS